MPPRIRSCKPEHFLAMHSQIDLLLDLTEEKNTTIEKAIDSDFNKFKRCCVFHIRVRVIKVTKNIRV